jgi:hypothetical protein
VAPRTPIRVYIESGNKRAFASAADWPGWCRGGKTEAAALEALATYTPRYAAVARLAGLEPPSPTAEFEVVEKLPGNATTDFGAPGVPARDEARAMSREEVARVSALVEASWKYLDRVIAGAPAVLRKGPRGGGRDRDAMFAHVLGAEVEYYAKAIGLRMKQPDGGDAAAIRAFRKAFLEALADTGRKERWPAPYAARRTAWHALDHAWEMEDRST